MTLKFMTQTATLLVGTTLAGAVMAGPSDHSFAWTHGIGLVQLVIDGSVTLTASNRGWVQVDGINNFGDASGNYLAGVCGSSDSCGGNDLPLNNYFAFQAATSAPATTLVLQLYQPAVGENGGAMGGFLSQSPSLDYTVFDVLLNPLTTSSVAMFTDLGSGTSYGGVTVDASSNGTMVSVALNAAGVSAFNAAAANQGMFFVGGSVSAVPELGTYALMLLGLGGIGAAARRRR